VFSADEVVGGSGTDRKPTGSVHVDEGVSVPFEFTTCACRVLGFCAPEIARKVWARVLGYGHRDLRHAYRKG